MFEHGLRIKTLFKGKHVTLFLKIQKTVRRLSQIFHQARFLDGHPGDTYYFQGKRENW